MNLIILLAVVLVNIGTGAAIEEKTLAELQGATFLQRDAYFKPQDYLFDYSPEAKDRSVRITEKYGSATFMQLPQNPSLSGIALGSSRFDMYPCAILQPHTHRVDGQIYVLEGHFRAGFIVQTFGKVVENKLYPGMGMVFPRGSLMYLENLSSKKNASFLATYNSNDFGVDLMIPLLFNTVPSHITRYAMGGLTQKEYEKIKNNIPANQIYTVNRECLNQN
ncbi:unnamed protein product [Adineta steineri]|uniref:Cupin type-1 domain-containing protein n=1 Tax=Adineta steineri TaxID=433720 RepID=A0A819DLF2_9BILA|nr:unnamed protein product [Adineta steineri]CAF3831534.1 unnamed protein product [Adineta steineri]